MRPAYQTVAIISTVAIYSVAFLLPAANPYLDPVDPKFRRWTGYKTFLLGWHLLTHWKRDDPFIGLQLAAVTGWMANPAVWLAFVSAVRRRWWWVRVFGGVGVSLALSLLIVPKFADALAGQPGYWAWAISAIGMFVVGWLAHRYRPRTVPA